MTIVWPGEGDHAQAYQPLSGSGCDPVTGSVLAPKTQSSKKIGIALIRCLSQIERNLSNALMKCFGFSA